MTDQTPAGWYPDPEVPGQQRYWDGSAWTEHRAPLQGQPGAGHQGAAQQPAPQAPQAQPGATPAKGNWFARHKILSAVLAVVVLAIVVSALTSGSESSDPAAASDSAATDTEASPGSGDDGSAGESADDSAEPETNPYEEMYGTFKPLHESGTGDGTIALPDGAAAGVVTMKHRGSANFAVTVLDESNQPTGDLLANTIGSYHGTAAYGLSSLGEATKLKVTADGSWKITVKPIAKAKERTLPVKGNGDTVFLYSGDAADWTFKHQGQQNFAVVQYSDDVMPNLMVNEIGSYQGTVPAVAGPSVVTVTADGRWSIKE